MIADIGGYLKGSLVDMETSIFRGTGNLPALAPEGKFFFLGVSIEGGDVLTFGDINNDDLVFLAANYDPTSGESLSQLIFLEKKLLDSWLLENGNPPTSEEWCIVSFSDWEPTNDNNRLNAFGTLKEFQQGCAIFVEFCVKLIEPYALIK
jgi:hypothetical protein